MRHSVPSMPAGPAAVVSCHVERPLDDDAWRRFDALQRRRPGGFDVIALIRPPDPAHGEDEQRWLERARAAGQFSAQVGTPGCLRPRRLLTSRA